ncbi:SDR family oxidoreductase [Gaoshiqia sediminis]|uniref:SDR family oxidoreductase n=1 Tax=Gaoshiqia sediminis TaxID=2986998 RepID=A0AA41Y7I7_9BACT|nr:SDR family oxidoreductase [Gaoshiqia sediminis]MCW0482921.1 SDR family oxidoreductase [Gaoshiqia sediminis]
MKRNIVVTGGGQGVGRMITRLLLEKGFRVTVLEVDEEAIRELKEIFPSENLLVVETDVSSEIQVKTALEFAVETFGRIDGLVNNAMVQIDKPITELQVAEWERVLAINLTGPFLCAKYAAGELRQNKGSIINLCSTRALQSEPNTEAYSASKGGLLALTHALAMSLAPDVRVNAISPGWIEVSALKKKSQQRPVHLSAEDHAQHPAGRVGRAEDIANMVLFLLQPENDFITAQNFVIDGGMTKKMIYC